MQKEYDIIIIGGGINGCAIAADAQMRGLSVALCEKQDLAAGTSSHSSKLIHGGLRYLESYQFSLVRKALKERDVLLKVCPHLISPQPFVLPYNKNLRPYWLLRLGLTLYDNLYQGQLPKSQSISRNSHSNYFKPLKEAFQSGFYYYDAKTNDARLVVENALQAKKYGADIFLHTEVTHAQPVAGGWRVTVNREKNEQTLQAKVIINAAGPEVSHVNRCLAIKTPYALSLVKGSHIIVPKLYQGEQAYILQHDDKRIVFAIPYEKHFTLIGTTEEPQKDYSMPTISEAEIDYLCTLINNNFHKKLSSSDITLSFSGLRPLINTQASHTSSESRDYKIYLNKNETGSPAVSIFGGKITTYRVLAKKTLDMLKEHFPAMKECKSDKIPLPGSDVDNYAAFIKEVQKEYTWLPKTLFTRYLELYGRRIEELLKNKNSLNCLGKSFNHHLYEAEIDYLKNHEWARSANDILFRRTNLILHTSLEEREQIEKELSN